MARRRSKEKADPHAEREAAKYERPIPSREFIMQLLEEREEPLTGEQIVEALGLTDETDQESLRRRLNAMERDGQVVRNRRGGYGLVDKMDLVRGRVIGHPDGFGFLVPDEGGDDLYLSPRQMRFCIHGDRAVARISGIDRRGRREGVLVEILERGTQRVVGRFYKQEEQVGVVVPDNKRITHDILVPADHQGAARHDQIVVVELLQQPDKYTRPLGRVIEVLGDHMAPGLEIEVAIRSHEIPLEWPAGVRGEIAGLSPEVPEEAKKGRVDLRETPLVTIDGADARDFDDAVYCERRRNGWRLLVAIADVSSYVDPYTALDNEARERGNSVYFPQRVIPMLPEILSNGLCSLNPHVDRLCLVCEMFIDDEGEITRHRFFEGVMRSAARLIYDDVAAMLAGEEPALREKHAVLLPHLEELYALYKSLYQARQRRGAIDFETTETRIVFGPERKIDRIVPVVRNDAHRIIEECMIAANVAAARFLLNRKIPAIYRVHPGPTMEKLADLRAFLGEVGLTLRGGEKPEARHYAELLNQVRGRPDHRLLQTVMLRSLGQATYHPENTGHFGLAHEAYTHFTSPIRRYPDLLVHRAIRHAVAGKKAKTFGYSVDDMASFGEHCSTTERRADEATRDAVDWLKCEFMLDKVGEEFDGIISSVTSFGIFVELKEIYVEGLVHVTALKNDYYHFDSVGHRLRGEHTGKVYRLSDPVRIRVMRVDLDNRRIDFDLAETQPEERAAKKKKKVTGPAEPEARQSTLEGKPKAVKKKRKPRRRRKQAA
ncbi:MAG: ribonuclease R [Pseudomonadota bacterium]